MAIKSSSPNLDCINRGGTEPKKKVKKIRSMKLSKTQSFKQSPRWVETQFDRATVDSSGDDASSEVSQTELSDTSSNYKKATSCSEANKESSQVGNESEGASVSSSTYGSTSSKPSSPSEDIGIRGGTKLKKTIKKSRSIRIGSFGSLRSTRRQAESIIKQHTSSLSSDAATPLIKVVDASPNYLKATSCSKGKKMHFQASLYDSESDFVSNDESYSHNSKSNSDSSSLKSMKTLTRTSSLRTSRNLIKKSSFKSKRSSMNKCSRVSQDLDVNRATCSSTLKDTKFSHHIEVHPGGRESERISVMKVCPYNYCSLHGHHHSTTAPLKCLLSKRRRLFKTQKSIKLRSQSSVRAKYPDVITKEIEANQMVFNGDSELLDKADASRAIFPVRKEGSDFSVQIHTNPRVEFFSRQSNGNEDANLVEVLSDGTSYPEKGVQENLNQERSFLVAEQDILEALSNEDNNYTLVGDHSELPDFCSSLLSLKQDNSVTICCEEVPSLHWGFHESENADLTDASGEPSNIGKRSTSDDMREATENSSVIPSASICDTLEELSAARDEKNGDSATDHETVGEFTPVEDSGSGSTVCEAYKTRLHKKKHISTWNLIHQHMASGQAAGARTQLLEGLDEEKQVDDTNKFTSSQSLGCSPGFSDSYQNMGIESHDTDKQEIELRKMYAIKMVREAIEKILLPEVQDQSSDDQSVSGDSISCQEFLEKDNDEGGKLSIPNSTADKISGLEQEVSASREGNKSYNQTPKRWSNLKKLILLKRFIKELEKVRKFSPQKQQHQPLEPAPEAEKVCLRRQIMDNKKSAEEWMLDYALQQVVDELAPAQKRKVALLIKAFETVVPPSDEQQIQVIFPKLEGIRYEGCSTESGMDKSVSEATYKDTKVADIVTSNLDGGDKNSIVNDKQSNMPVAGKAEQEVHEDRISAFNLELLKDGSTASGKNMELDVLSGISGQPLDITKSRNADCNGESTVTDNIASSASYNDPLQQLTVVGEVKIEASDPWGQLTIEYNQKPTLTGEHCHFTKPHSPAHPLKPDDSVSTCSEEVANMNSEFCKKDDHGSNSNKLEIDDFTGATVRPSGISKRPTPDDLAEAATDNTQISSAYSGGHLEELTAAKEERNEDCELDAESIEGFGPVRDSEPDTTSREANKTQFDKKKHVNMWHLIHQNMVAGLAVEGKTIDKENKEQVDDVNTLAATKSSDSCPGFSASFQKTEMENNDTDSQEIELRKIFAIKLVRQAIEKILLPEVQDQSSDDQSITSETISEQELIEKNCGEGGEPSVTTSTYSAKNDPSECDNNKFRDETSLSQEGSQGTRFATANISELRDEKPASEVQNKSDKQTPKRWSYLKKVILLKRFIKELEKVRKFKPQKPQHLPSKPGPEAEEVCLRHQMTDARKNAEEWMLDFALRQVVSELAPKQKRKVALLVKAFETVVPASEEQQIQMTFPKSKRASDACYCTESEQAKSVSKAIETVIKVEDIVRSDLDNGDNSSITDKQSDVPVDEEAQKEVHKDTVSSFHLELVKDVYELNTKKVKLDGLSGVNVEPSRVTKRPAPDGSGASTATYDFGSSAKEKNADSETGCTAKVAYKTQLDKQKYITMWHLLCQHVVSGVATKVETGLLDREDEEEQVDRAKTLHQTRTSASCHEYSRADHDRSKEDPDASSQKIEFNKRDAIELVQEAIDEILLPEIPDDSSDAQSISSDIILEQELLEKNDGNGGEQSILISINSPKDSFREYDKSEVDGHNIMGRQEKGSATDSIPSSDEQRAVSMVGNKSDQKKLKNWRKLKKLILLKRSIKALEKVRELNLRAPQNLPLESDPEAEKVDLRNQLKEERKKAEEWMLDYALQHIVTKLTPARKRRVSMLVEAFEAVVPLPEI